MPFTDWAFIDSAPGLPLDDIGSLAGKAFSWAARAQKLRPFERAEHFKISGALHAVDGLDYHAENYFELELRLADRRKAGADRRPTPAELDWTRGLEHEAAAYLNRLGKFLIFATKIGHDHSCLVRCKELQCFRNKNTAHASLDDPRKGDTEAAAIDHVMAFGHGYFWKAEGYFHQMHHRGTVLVFRMKNDHPIVAKEIIMFLLGYRSI